MKTEKIVIIIAVVALVAMIVIFAAQNLTVYEDGSFVFTLSGCLPGGICN